MDGWEFLEAVFQEGNIQTIRINILTSSVDLHEQDKASKNPHVNSFLIKPLNKQKLKDLFSYKTSELP
jgi:response regulator RpfG family c-di-GMP phosphodiesterase